MNILQVNTYDVAGGAEKVAMSLHHCIRNMGHTSFLAVGSRRSQNPHVLTIPNDRSRALWARLCITLACMNILQKPDDLASRMLRTWIFWLGQPKRHMDILLGHEDFNYPGTKKLLDITPLRPDILHCHNLHGGYFDLRTLPVLGSRIPIVLTLHDAWLLSGHCAHSFACERWKTGCGWCPDLTIYPSIRRDSTAFNFRRKQKIYNQCRFNVATPSQWLMNKVNQSILAPRIDSSCIIANGVDLNTFRPDDKTKVRALLGIDAGKSVLLFSANGIRNNPWKDFRTLRASIARLASRDAGREILFIALGESAPPETIGAAAIRYIPFQTSPESVAHYYQAADLYIHAAREETFGISIVEALACGTPVVATSVGGIPEIVHNLDIGAPLCTFPAHPLQTATGLLIRCGESETLAHGIEWLLTHRDIHEQLGWNGVADAKNRFDLRKQAETYVQWYQEILRNRGYDDASKHIMS